MIEAIILDDFATAPPANDTPVQDYDTGVADGYAKATNEISKSQTLLTDALVQSIQDMNFTYSEVRHEILSGLGAVFDGILDQLLPAMIDHRLKSEIKDRVAATTEQHLGQPQLRLHPDTAEALNSSAGIDLGPFNVQIDPNTPKNAAHWMIDRSETIVDFTGLCDEIKNTFETILNERPHAHG